MRWNCRSKALRFLQITAKNQDFPFLSVFLIIKTSFQNISKTLLRFCSNFTNIEATVLEKKAPVNDFVRFPCRESWSYFVAMITPMSLHPWWWQIFILIQLWSQFFQMFDYCDVVYTQTCYWPWKTVSSHLHMPGRPMLLQYGPHFFSTLS